jgi:5-deoxy-glucuronate isomerase
VSHARHFPDVREIAPADAGWGYSGLRVLDLAPGEARRLATGDAEMLVLPLAGSCTVECDGETFELQGRRSVFSRVSDFAYLPRDAEVTVTSRDGGRFALPSARCERRLPARYGAAEDVPVELRGAGQSSRQVNNVAAAHTFECDRLIVVEVLTPESNWSSYPPHKHDEDRPGEESVLEEIYYFEVADGPQGAGIGYQRVYGTDERPEDLLAEVRTGDAVTIPHG